MDAAISVYISLSFHLSEAQFHSTPPYSRLSLSAYQRDASSVPRMRILQEDSQGT